MRILYLHRTQGEEPESIHINAIVTALRELRHDVTVVGPSRVDKVAATSEQRSALRGVKKVVPGWAFELLQMGYNLVALWNLIRAVRRVRPDFIYERYALYSFAGVLVARWLKIPLILEVNTPYAQAWAHFYGIRFKRFARRLENWTLRSAPQIITVTQVQCELLTKEGVPPTRITVCHNAIDPAWFDPKLHRVEGLRERLALGEVVIGFVGTMNRWQGIPKFAEVIDTVLSTQPSASFLFVGDGEFRSSLEDDCLARGFADRVRFVGRRPHQEIPDYIQLMDIAVLLNSNDYGSPMKIFEYWAMEKAVIAPEVVPVTEILTDGETGLLIPRGDALAMSRRIVELLKDPALRERLGQSGRRLVLARHTWTSNAQKILDVYGKLNQQAG
jgi:glycosyltransferase involved in cell wall biosynthesis